MNILQQGGFFIIPLLLCSVLMVAIIGERLYVFAKTLPTPLSERDNPALEIKKLRRHLMTLYTLMVIAPMLGLLGTVTGLMKCFNLLGKQTGVYNPKLLSLGIAEALITTAAGLLITIIATAFYNYFNSRLEDYVYDYNTAIRTERDHG